LPESLIQRGTSFSTEAVHKTRVSPIEIKTDPGVASVYPSSIRIGRVWSFALSVIRPTVPGIRDGNPIDRFGGSMILQTEIRVPGVANLTGLP
jgi:hypothetical protein